MASVADREDCLALDAADPLAVLRDQFDLPSGVIYLDGNSLGPLPRATRRRVAGVVDEEWGAGLIRSWNDAGWIDLPRVVGDKIGRLVGAGPGEIAVTDSTSVNLFKVVVAAFEAAVSSATARGGTQARGSGALRFAVLSDVGNFPTDLYIAASAARAMGGELRLVETEALAAAMSEDVAVLLLTEVDYRTGRMHDMRAVTAAAHEVGALVIWDLSHSAGAVPVDLAAAGADFAVGCGYKYLNGGPGAPAFVWVSPKHVEATRQPLSGWLGHAEPFAFESTYRPAAGIGRYLCGTPPILSLAALDCGVDTLLAAEPFGGLGALHSKALALADVFADLVVRRCAEHGVEVVSDRTGARRGCQVSLTREEGGGAIVRALIERGVIGDFRRAPRARPGGGAGAGVSDVVAGKDIMRFGLAPLYLRFVDMWDAVEQLRDVLDSEAWREPRFQTEAAVT